MDPSVPWVAHDHPERPFDRFIWLCACRGCALALQVEARHRPWLRLCVKTAAARHVLEAVRFAACLGNLQQLLSVVGDTVREVYVVGDVPEAA